MLSNTKQKLEKKVLSAEHKRKIALAIKSLGNNHPCKNPKVREKIRKSLLGRKPTEECLLRQKEAMPTGKNHHYWKGDRAGYIPIHAWVARWLGKPDKCEQCGKIKYGRYIQWANRDHQYRRDFKDWMRLCTKCHFAYDIKNGLRELPTICLPR